MTIRETASFLSLLARGSLILALVLGPLGRGGAAENPTSIQIKAGFAEEDITPDIGMEQPAGYMKMRHTSFHDPCKVRVAVFDDGHRRVALVGLDACFIYRPVVLDARAQIEAACGIPPSAVLINASHSHSSGPTGVVQPGQFDGASAEVRRLAYEDTSCADAGYLLRVTHQIVEGVKAAAASCVPARIGFGFGQEGTVSFNRRLRMKNGQTWTHPGAMNPDILGYAGPIDPQVGVVGAWDLGGRLLGVIVNFSCHATTSPGGISANWPGYMEATIQGALGTRAPVVFLQGACGNVTQVDNLSPDETPTPADWAERVGGRVGAEAVKVLVGMAKGSDLPLDTRQRIWKIKRRAPSPETVARSRRIVEAGQPKPGASQHARVEQTAWIFAKEILLLDYLVSVEPEVEVEVQAIQVGPAVFVSDPAEYFVEYGLAIKKASPFRFTFPVELADGCVGYVPTEEAFGPHGGGYETRLDGYSNLEITAGRQFEEAGIALAREMRPGPAPEFPRITGPRDPWTYGNAPAELR